jgi:phosphoglycerol transferase MdoB-like AlkP superfamily enzyme
MAFYNPILSEEFLINNEDNIIERFTSPYDLVPTLYDLLGLKYNQNLFPGNSIFLSETPVFYSHKLTGFFNDNFYSDDGEEIIYNSLDFPLSKEEEFLLESAKQRVKLDYINYWYNETKRKK